MAGRRMLNAEEPRPATGDREWTEIGRGYGPAEFDFHAHTDGPADYIQLRNEGSEPLYVDAAEARYVRRD